MDNTQMNIEEILENAQWRISYSDKIQGHRRGNTEVNSQDEWVGYICRMNGSRTHTQKKKKT